MLALFRVTLVVALALFSCVIAAMYLRELFVFFTNRDAYDQMRKPKLSFGEEGDTPVAAADRLAVSYPLFILLSGGLALGLGLHLLHEAS